MHATYAADMDRIRELHRQEMFSEVATERGRARMALGMLSDDYRALAPCDAKDDAVQDQLFAAVVDRAYQQHLHLQSYGPAL
jgi:hypothetical protein